MPAQKLRIRKKNCHTVMSWFKNLPSGCKFFFAFGAVCTLSPPAWTSTPSLPSAGIASTKMVDVSADTLPSIVALSKAHQAIHRVRMEDIQLCLLRVHLQALVPIASRLLPIMYVAEKLYVPLISYPGEREAYEKLLGTKLSSTVDISNRANSPIAADKPTDALLLLLSDATTAQIE